MCGQVDFGNCQSTSFNIYRTPIVWHWPPPASGGSHQGQVGIAAPVPSPHSLLVLPPLQALTVSRGHPGQGCRQHLHPPQWLPCPQEQAPAEVSWPRVLGWEGAALGPESFLCSSCPPGMLWT